MANVIYSGNDVAISVQLTTNGSNAAVSLSATVTAGIIDDSRTLIAGPWTCTSGATGADWTTGLVVVPVDGTDTTDAFTGGRTIPFNGCRMEVKVVSGATSITRRSNEKFQLAKAAV